MTLYNDQPLPINELSLVRGGRTKINEVLRDVAYAVAEGRGRALNSRSQYSTLLSQGSSKPSSSRPQNDQSSNMPRTPALNEMAVSS
ncbi:hypothetical protein Q6294_29930, partial [Klebsiella pneumoniae]